MAFPAGQDLRVAIQQDSSLSAYFGARNYAGSFPNSVHMNDLWGALRFVRYRNTAATSAFVGSSDDVQLSSFQYIALQAHYLLLLVIMVPSVAVNGLVFVLPYQRVSVRMTSNKFVLNMAVVHLLQTFLVLPFVFVSAMLRRWIFGDMCCKIHGSLTIFLAVANVFSILLIAIDRNCAVNSPLRYAMTIKKRRYSGLIASTWVVALLLSLPPLLDLCDVRYQDSWVTCTVTWYDSSLFTVAYSSVLCVIGFLVPFVWVAWIYASLYRAARRNSARARLNSVNATSSAEISSPSSTGYQGGGHPAFHFPRRMTWSRRSPSLVQASALFGDEWKAVRTSVLVVMSFTACFFPFFFMTLLELHARISNTAFRMLPAIAMLLLFCSTLISPYLYVLRNKATRKLVRKMFSIKRKPSFFSPQGYHYSHQSPPPERKCSSETIPTQRSVVSTRSASVDYQRPIVDNSSYRKYSGGWKVVSSTAHSRQSLSELTSAIMTQPLNVDETGQQRRKAVSYLNHGDGAVLRAAAISDGCYRRASLESSHVLRTKVSAEFQSLPRHKSLKITSRVCSDRRSSLGLQERYTSREQFTETCDKLCGNGQGEWKSHFVSQHYRASNAEQDPQSNVPSQGNSFQVYRPAPVDTSSIAQIHHHYVSAARAPSPSGRYRRRRPLKWGQSFAVEHEMVAAFPPKRISQSCRTWRSRFVGARSGVAHVSSGATTALQSLSFRDSLDMRMIKCPPPLSPTRASPAPRYPPSQAPRQQRRSASSHGYPSTPVRVVSQEQRTTKKAPGCQDRRDSGFEEGAMCECQLCGTTVDATRFMEADKFVERK